MLDDPQLAETDYDYVSPIRRRSAQALAENGKAYVPASGATGQRSLRVLVAGNDPETADALVQSIVGWGHDVRCACNGAAGLEVAAAQSPDVALLDISLAGMEGYALAQRLRRDSHLKDCFIVALRWHTDRRREEQFKATDFDLYLPKPVDLFVLETLLMLEAERLGKRAQYLKLL